jgi:hypothetical protein
VIIDGNCVGCGEWFSAIVDDDGPLPEFCTPWCEEQSQAAPAVPAAPVAPVAPVAPPAKPVVEPVRVVTPAPAPVRKAVSKVAAAATRATKPAPVAPPPAKVAVKAAARASTKAPVKAARPAPPQPVEWPPLHRSAAAGKICEACWLRDRIKMSVLCLPCTEMVVRSCRGKVRNLSPQEAMDAWRRRQPEEQKKLGWYPCPLCDSWHLGGTTTWQKAKQVHFTSETLSAALPDDLRMLLRVEWGPPSRGVNLRIRPQSQVPDWFAAGTG